MGKLVIKLEEKESNILTEVEDMGIEGILFYATALSVAAAKEMNMTKEELFKAVDKQWP